MVFSVGIYYSSCTFFPTTLLPPSLSLYILTEARLKSIQVNYDLALQSFAHNKVNIRYWKLWLIGSVNIDKFTYVRAINNLKSENKGCSCYYLSIIILFVYKNNVSSLDQLYLPIAIKSIICEDIYILTWILVRFLWKCKDVLNGPCPLKFIC